MSTPPTPSPAPHTLTQLLRFGIVGVVSNVLGYMVYLFITSLGTNPKLTMTVLYSCAATLGFFGNKNLTFQHDGGTLGTGTRYAIAYALGYLFNLSLLVLFVDYQGYPHQIVQAIAIVVVALFLFVLQKYYVFKVPTA